MITQRTFDTGSTGQSFIPWDDIEATDIRLNKRNYHEYCGAHMIDVHKYGGFYSSPLLCGDWHKCDYCRYDRGEKYHARATKHMTDVGPDGSQRPIILTKQVSVEMAKMLVELFADIHLYLRIPITLNRTVFMADGSLSKILDLYDIKYDWYIEATELDGVNWTSLCNSPYKTRLTGKLGLDEDKDDPDAVEIVGERMRVYTDAPLAAKVVAMQEAIMITPTVPTTPQEVFDCANARNAAFADTLERDGYYIERHYYTGHMKIVTYDIGQWLTICNEVEAQYKMKLLYSRCNNNGRPEKLLSRLC